MLATQNLHMIAGLHGRVGAAEPPESYHPPADGAMPLTASYPQVTLPPLNSSTPGGSSPQPQVSASVAHLLRGILEQEIRLGAEPCQQDAEGRADGNKEVGSCRRQREEGEED